MAVAIAVVGGLLAIAFVLFAVLAWRIAPIVFMLMRSQAAYAETMQDFIRAVEAADGRIDVLVSSDLRDIREQLARLEKAKAKPAVRSRRKVTA
jgi:hypothetical protein